MSEKRCTCISCGSCGGTGNVWFTFDGKYLGKHRTDDLDELERCDDCEGSGISEECDYCVDSRDDFDAYESAGESPFSLPGGGKSL
jgi:hypothetical protein